MEWEWSFLLFGGEFVGWVFEVGKVIFGFCDFFLLVNRL